jgi:hypothetical protein
MPVWNCQPATTEYKPSQNRENPEIQGGVCMHDVCEYKRVWSGLVASA